MRFHGLMTAMLAILGSILATGCSPKLQGGGFADNNVLVGFGNWDGTGAGFGAYSLSGSIQGGTKVCLYQDTNNDGKLDCDELQGCVKKESGGSKYVLGGVSAAGGTVPPAGVICGRVQYRDGSGNDHSACVVAKTQPQVPLNICGLKDCCPCLECPGNQGSSNNDGGGHALEMAVVSASTLQVPPGHAHYDFLGAQGQIELRVTHDAAGTSWTILAGNNLQASSIERVVVDASGTVVEREVLTHTQAAEGILATYSGSAKDNCYTIFSARNAAGPIRNFFVSAVEHSDLAAEELLATVHAAVFQ